MLVSSPSYYISIHESLLVSIHVCCYTIGNKFPSKSLELFLNATVYFGDHLPGQTSSTEDPFCVGLNAYIEVGCLYVSGLVIAMTCRVTDCRFTSRCQISLSVVVTSTNAQSLSILILNQS